MKRMLLIAVTSSAALVLGAPAVASAHGSRHHHARHHARRARVLFFGTAPAGSPSGTVGSSDTSPTPPSPSSESSTGEAAGKVKSFEGGVLTIVLSDGTTVSGKVTERTELECQSATPAPTATTSTEDDHEDSHAEGSHEDGGDGSSTEGTETSRDDSGDGSGDSSGPSTSGESPSCTTAALTPETVVREAELRVSSSGAEWEKVDLLLK